MIFGVTILKYMIKRPRPILREDTKRLSNLRRFENGTYSLPSGDSGAAAVFCYIIYFCFQAPLIFLILPLVCLGRVYYHCHWIGDTLIGSTIGIFTALSGFAYINSMVPVFEAISGS